MSVTVEEILARRNQFVTIPLKNIPVDLRDKIPMDKVVAQGNCGKCHGRGFTQWDAKTKVPILCKCVLVKFDPPKPKTIWQKFKWWITDRRIQFLQWKVNLKKRFSKEPAKPQEVKHGSDKR
jgi:hypothetical protein